MLNVAGHEITRALHDVVQSVDDRSTVAAPTQLGICSNDTLDLLAVMRASQVISGEVVLDDLLRKLMSTLIESAGAQRGMILLSGDSPRVVVGGRRAGAEAAAVHFPSAAEEAACSEGIVRYVERTHEKVVLGDAAVRGPFTADPYVAARSPRSILCLPILKQKKALGVLYLENNLAADAFTPARIEILEILSTQTAISLENARLYDTLENRVRDRTAELSLALDRLKETQQLLVMHEKLASLGMLTSGIAHEIKNPLNFVNNFAELSVAASGELLEEVGALRARLGGEAADYLGELAGDLRQNALKIQEHGQRADRIVSAMLVHSRTSGGEVRTVELNALVRDYTQLACQGQRTSPGSAPPRLELTLDSAVGALEILPEEIGRVLVNLVTNALHAAAARKRLLGEGFEPAVRVSTRDRVDHIELLVHDNGGGIPSAIRDKIYNPFFTTKPPGEGTGLGLSISYDIVVQGHGGTMTFETEESRFTEFVVTLPKRAPRHPAARA